MKGFLKYLGEVPVHSLKQDWTPGMEVSLEKLHKSLGKSSGSSSADEAFVGWFHSTFMSRLGRDFELILQDDEDVGSAEVAELAAVKDEDRSGSVNLEASNIETAGSLKEAQAKLKSMRHPDVVGEMDLTKHEETAMSKVTKTEEFRRNQKELLGAVMTGDDLVNQNRFSSMVLQQDGSARGVVGNDKDKEKEDSAKMANLSKRASILTQDVLNSDGSTSQVMIGEDNTPNQHTVGFQKKAVEGLEEDSNRKNKNFKGYPTFNSGAPVSPEAIMSAATEHEAKALIEACKDPTTLRVAKIYAKDTGNHRIRELIERKLRSLPLRS